MNPLLRRRTLMWVVLKSKQPQPPTESYIDGYANYPYITLNYTLDGGQTYHHVVTESDGYWRIDLDINNPITSLEKFLYPGDNDEYQENYNVKSIDFSHISDSSRIRSMAWMCKSLSQLETVNLHGLERAKPTDIGQIFNSCEKLTTLDMSMIDGTHVNSTVTNHGYATMLYGCTGLTEVKLPSFVNAYIGSSPFGRDTALISIPVCGTIDVNRFVIADSPLTLSSALVLINALSNRNGKTAGELKLSSTTYNLLTSSHKAIAENKNWSITH